MKTERKDTRPEGLTLEGVARFAREVTLSDGYHIPTLLVEGDGERVVGQFPELPGSPEARRDMLRAAGTALARGGALAGVRRVFFICEAWMSVAGEDGPPHVPPSQDPARLEVLIVSGMEVEERRAGMVIFQMLRDADGRLTTLEPYDVPVDEDAQAESPLLEAFVDGFQRALRGRAN